MRLLLALVALCAGGCAKRYHMEGLVTAVDAGRQTITVSHKTVPGYMPAMVMPFRVANSADVGRVKPGSRIRFDLSKSQVRHIRIIDTKQDFVPPTQRKWRQSAMRFRTSS